MSTPAPSGASSGASSSQGTPQGGQAQPQQRQSSPQGGFDNGGPGFDVDGAFKEARTARKETKELRSTFDKSSREMQETRQVLDRVKSAFAPETQTKADPYASAIQEAEEQMDYYIEQAMEAKQRGQAMPLTTNLAIRQFQEQIENIKFRQQILSQIEKLTGGVQQANDPEVMVNNNAYTQMESSIQDQLDGLYGQDPGAMGVKKQMYHSVVNILQANLRELQAKAPGQWDMARRDPNKLRQMVQAAVRQVVPPRAMQLIENEQLQNTPMGGGELRRAWEEAGQIQDPRERQRIRTMLRQDILSAKMLDLKRRR